MRDIYGIEISADLVSKITDKVMPVLTEWQGRPLERVYPIMRDPSNQKHTEVCIIQGS